MFEKWRDDNGQAWAHISYNGAACVVGDAVARQTAHPQLQQPLHVFAMEALEEALEPVSPSPLFWSRAASYGVVTCRVIRSLHDSCAVYLSHQELRPRQPLPREQPAAAAAALHVQGAAGLPRVTCTIQVRDSQSPRGTFVGLVDRADGATAAPTVKS